MRYAHHIVWFAAPGVALVCIMQSYLEKLGRQIGHLVCDGTKCRIKATWVSKYVKYYANKINAIVCAEQFKKTNRNSTNSATEVTFRKPTPKSSIFDFNHYTKNAPCPQDTPKILMSLWAFIFSSVERFLSEKSHCWDEQPSPHCCLPGTQSDTAEMPVFAHSGTSLWLGGCRLGQPQQASSHFKRNKQEQFIRASLGSFR